jgi:bifunctional non-homologous end joining protein LigD
VVFDLDPGLPATLVECCRVALRIRMLLGDLGLQAWPKTSGWSGVHVYAPVNGPVVYDQTKAFARAVARRLEREDPGSVTSVMARTNRPGKVFVDWSQNDPGKSTVAPYSLRGREVPTVSVPVGWDEVESVAANGDARPLAFLASDTLARADDGDLFAPVLTVTQQLPPLVPPV